MGAAGLTVDGTSVGIQCFSYLPLAGWGPLAPAGLTANGGYGACPLVLRLPRARRSLLRLPRARRSRGRRWGRMFSLQCGLSVVSAVDYDRCVRSESGLTLGPMALAL